MKGQRAQQDGIDHAEDCNIGADAEGEDQNRHHGEGAIAAQGAQSKAQVLSDGGDPQRAPAFPAIFFDLVQAAEGESRGASGLLFRHAGAHIFGHLLLEVKTQFFVQVLFQLLAVAKGAATSS